MRRLQIPSGLAIVLLCACDLAWQAPGIQQDVRGDWQVAFSNLAVEGAAEACTLTGLVLTLDEGRPTRVPGGSAVPVSGTYSSSVLTCGDRAPAAQPAGTVTGSIRGSQLPLRLSNSSDLAGVIFRPEMSWTLVRLQGTVRWFSAAGVVSGSWQTDARETSSHF